MPTAVLSSSRRQAVRDLAFDLGFDHCEFSPLTISDLDRDAYVSWIERGSAAGMAYMTADPSSRLEPRARFSGARSVLSLGISYYQGPVPPKPGAAYGRVARYAWGEDYHPLILQRLDALKERLPGVLGADIQAQSAIDTRPLLERALARQAGLGFVGKNTVLIVPRHGPGSFHVGSFVFLAELLIDADVDDPAPPVTAGCGSCTRCQTICPTAAFDGPYKLNAGRCIAYLTIENKGWIPREMRAPIGDWLFGCDLCQDVCPFNARVRDPLARVPRRPRRGAVGGPRGPSRSEWSVVQGALRDDAVRPVQTPGHAAQRLRGCRKQRRRFPRSGSRDVDRRRGSRRARPRAVERSRLRPRAGAGRETFIDRSRRGRPRGSRLFHGEWTCLRPGRPGWSRPSS